VPVNGASERRALLYAMIALHIEEQDTDANPLLSAAVPPLATVMAAVVRSEALLVDRHGNQCVCANCDTVK
jgi:hypothetical protein